MSVILLILFSIVYIFLGAIFKLATPKSKRTKFWRHK